jgi:hypothetical protein
MEYNIKSALVVLLLCLLILLSGCNNEQLRQISREVLSNGAYKGTGLSLQEIDAGLREALRVGSERVVAQVGKTDGFNADAVIRIPLPERLAAARLTLDKVGMGGVFNDLEVRLNRAAELAAPQAKAIFWQAIREMSIQDVNTIFRGQEDAATRYFQTKMTPALAAAMQPVIEQSLNEVGAVRIYNQAVNQVRSLPFAPDIKTDLPGYVVDRGMAGIFHYLAEEEAAIRKNPAKRTTELLQRVFAGSY